MLLNCIRYLLVSSLVLFLSLSCSEDGAKDSSSASCSASEALNNPKTIEETINLINALPKPLTIDCFLTALKAPLKVFAVNSTFSAQPAVDQQSPRIFLIKDTFVLSVVPAGVGRNLLEFGEFNGGLESFKGEVEFPVESTVTIDSIVNQITQTSSSSTCLVCHAAERLAPYKSLGNLFASKFVRPSESQRVQQTYLKNQATACNPAINKLRCDILSAVYIKGEAQDAAFPY